MKLELPRIHRVKTGKRLVIAFEIPPRREGAYAELVVKGQPQDLYDVTISTPRRKRSTGWRSQNHHLNGHCMQISESTGQDFDAVKLYVKRQAISRGLPVKTNKDGEIVLSIVDGEPVPISESDMDTIQCGWCIDATHIIAAELGIFLREE